jgi:AcrR family transcriptional regulator
MATRPPAKRAYKLRKRADQQDLTRSRIVAATMALHEELGPRNTTISAIAQRAGVQRLTVYRHFPDEATLFRACTSTWLEQNPPPAPSPALEGETAEQTARRLLLALYRYYRQTRTMWSVSYRDVGEVTALRKPMAQFEAYLNSYRDAVLGAWKVARGQRGALKASATLATRLSTWSTLADEGLTDRAIAALAVRWLEAATIGDSV